MRVRARYTKSGKLRFISAIDLGRVWERALRRAGLPIAYSEGFSPHPRVSFPDGLRVLTAVEVAAGDPKLARWLQASCWDLSYSPAAVGWLAQAVAAVAAAPVLSVQRERKATSDLVDLRPALHQISRRDATVRVTLHHVEPPLRPSEAHAALRGHAEASTEPLLVTRLAQRRPCAAGLQEALTGDVIPPLGDPSRNDKDSYSD
ncbi:MAG TPA: TIGR03936 family radical SAM-associated protein [Egibacteraceae bacterium]|nr:TIGR03936 family radical SAM-associated protein [Egibacteraceae bacterium]